MVRAYFVGDTKIVVAGVVTVVLFPVSPGPVVTTGSLAGTSPDFVTAMLASAFFVAVLMTD